MLSLAAISLITVASASPRLTIHHGDATLLPVRPTAGEAADILAESTFSGRHEDGFDTMQVRTVHADEVGDVRLGQVWRAWTGPGTFTDCVVEGFFLEIAEPYDTPQTDELPALPPHEAGRAFAKLDCGADDIRPRLVVGVDDPVPFRLKLADAVSGAEVTANRDVVDTVLRDVLKTHPDVRSFRADIGDEPVGRYRNTQRADTRVGHLIIERGRWYTGEGLTGCGESDRMLPYLAIILDGPTPTLLRFETLAEGEWARDLVDIDRDGVPEVVVSDSVGETLTLMQGDHSLSHLEQVWWGYCPC